MKRGLRLFVTASAVLSVLVRRPTPMKRGLRLHHGGHGHDGLVLRPETHPDEEGIKTDPEM